MKNSKTRLKNKIFSYGYVLPLISIYCIFTLYPVFRLVFISFFEMKLYNVEVGEFIGLSNYFELFNFPTIFLVLKNTFVYVSLVIVIKIALGLLLAIFLYKDTILNKIVRTMIFIPTAMSMIAASLIWNSIYAPKYGLINNLLNFLHLEALTTAWLGNPKTALFSIIIIDVWQFTGFTVILLIAGISNIPASVFEAGKIDGTNKFTENIYITIPLIKKVFLTVTLFIITSGFKTFEYIYVTTKGGPMKSTHILGTYMFNTGFVDQNLSLAAAIGIILLIISTFFSGIFLYTSRFTK